MSGAGRACSGPAASTERCCGGANAWIAGAEKPESAPGRWVNTWGVGAWWVGHEADFGE